jgi:MFS family permease
LNNLLGFLLGTFRIFVKQFEDCEPKADLHDRFMIGGLCVAMPVGRLYGVWNAKWLYMISIILFMAGSALCGAAPSMATLIIGRVLAGAGGNGMYVGVVTLVSVNTSEKERPTYLGLM